MKHKLREKCDAAKRVRRARMVFDRQIDAVAVNTRRLEKEGVLEEDTVKEAKALLAALSTLVTPPPPPPPLGVQAG